MTMYQIKEYGIIKSLKLKDNRLDIQIRVNNGEMLNYTEAANKRKIVKNQRVLIQRTKKRVDKIRLLEDEATEGTVLLFLPAKRMLIVTTDGESLECYRDSINCTIGDKVKCDAVSFPEYEKAEYGKAQNVEVIPLKIADEKLADRICNILSSSFGNEPIPLSDCREALATSGIDPVSYGFYGNIALFLEQFPDKLHISYDNNTVRLADISQTFGKYHLAEKYIKEQGYESMTLLQKRVFSDAEFWERNRFLIAGSTSSGKTVIPITKYLIKRESTKRHQKMLIAVPLRALASQMKQSMINRLEKYDLDIAISTSEYVDRDDDILNGNVDIAIVIYEKIFIFCSERENFFDRFDIVVLDELNIYRSKERGVKAEVITLKLLDYQGELIMLGTPHCQWELHTKKYNLYPIKIFSRPVKIHEFFFKNIEPSPNQKSSYRLFFRTGQRIEAGYHFPFEDTLTRLCVQEYTLEHKCIVFKFSQTQTRILSKKIYQRLVCSLHLRYQSDDEVKAFKKEFLKYYNIVNEEISGIYDEIEEFRALMNGIAFHNASLPESMRMALEKELLDDPKMIPGGIRLIFATETIAYGLNSNVDTVVMTDMKKNEGIQNNDIRRDDYQNCIGRAGRLGYLTYGTSYAFLQGDTICVSETKQIDSIKYYRSDVSTDRNMKGHLADIIRKRDVDNFMFYCLSLCPRNQKFSKEDIVEIIEHASNYRDADKCYQVLSELTDMTFSCMEGYRIIEKVDDDDICYMFDDKGVYYQLTASGKNMKGCVLHRESFEKIKIAISKFSQGDHTYFFDLFYDFCDFCEITEYCSEIVSRHQPWLDHKKLVENQNNIDKDVKSVIRLAEYYIPIALEQQLISRKLADELFGSEVFTLFAELSENSIHDSVTDEELSFFNRLKLALVAVMWLKGYSLSLINSISGSGVGKLDNIRRKIGEKMSYFIDTAVAGSTVLGLPEDRITIMKQASQCMFYGIDIDLLKKREITDISPTEALCFHFASMYITRYRYNKATGNEDLQEFWNQVDDFNDRCKEILIEEGVVHE